MSQSATDSTTSGQPAGGWPSVTVVVPTHERPEPLLRCVRSILEQDYPGSVECIVVFDKSEITPLAIEPAPDRAVSLMQNTRTPGLAGARNTGIVAARGDLVAFCDDDDVWLPGKLAAQVGLLLADPGTSVVGCHIVMDGATGSITRPGQAVTVDLQDLLASRVVELHPSTLLARRPVLVEQIGLVDEEIPGSYGEDYDWLLRAAKLAPIRLVGRPLVQITWQTGSQFARRWDTISSALRFLLAKHPEFGGHRRGIARIEGQVAFAEAALGHRGQALRWAGRALRHHPGELRAFLALAVSVGVPVTAIMTAANRRGRSI